MSAARGSRLAWRNLSVKVKLTLVFGLQLALIAVIGLTVFLTLRNVQQQREILRSAQNLESLAGEVQSSFAQAHLYQFGLIHSWDEVGFDEASSANLPGHAQELDNVRGTITLLDETLATSPLESTARAQDIVARLNSVTEAYQAGFQEMTESLSVLARQNQGALSELTRREEVLDAQLAETQALGLELVALSREETNLALSTVDRINRLANQVVGISVVGAALLGAGLTFSLGRNFNLNLTRLLGAAQRLEAGDLSARAEPLGNDEFGRLANTINAMAGQLEDVIHGLQARAMERGRNLETIAEISQSITQLHSPDVLLKEVVELIRDRFDIYHAQVFLLDEPGEFAVLRESTGEVGKALREQGHRLRVGSQSVIGRVTAEGQPVVALDTDQDAVHRRNELLPNTRSELALPLRVGDKVIGALDLQSEKARAFDDDDVGTFQTMADQLAIALSNTQLSSESKVALSRVEALNQRLTGQAWETLANRRRTDTHTSFHLEGDTLLPDENSQALSTDLSDFAQQSILVSNGGEDGEMLVSVPIRVRGEVIGLFEFGGEDIRVPDEDGLALIEAVAQRIGLALENMRLFEQTQQLARREYLVNQITSKIVGSTDVSEILQTTVRELGKALRSPRTTVQLFGDQDNEQ